MGDSHNVCSRKTQEPVASISSSHVASIRTHNLNTAHKASSHGVHAPGAYTMPIITDAQSTAAKVHGCMDKLP